MIITHYLHMSKLKIKTVDRLNDSGRDLEFSLIPSIIQPFDLFESLKCDTKGFVTAKR